MLNTSIISLLALLYLTVGMFSFLSLWLYSIFFSDGICFVALHCTFSICFISPDLYGDQTAAAYSRCGLTRAWNRYLKLCSSRYVYVLLISPIILFVLFIWFCICVLNDIVSSTNTPMSFSPSDCSSLTSFPSLS